MSGARQLSLSRVVLHPLWLASLALLVLNDHVLKGAGLLPGVITGKLSDVTGMLVAPVVLACLLRVRSRRGLALAHVAVGVGFAVMEVTDFAPMLTDKALALVGMHWVATRDLGDLLVLLLLPLCDRWSAAVAANTVARTPLVAGPPRVTGETWLARGLVLGGALAGIASTESTPDPSCQGDCDQDGSPDYSDCNDYDASVNPAAGNCPGEDSNEDCENGVDDDMDGEEDCDDSDCQLACADSEEACELAPLLDVLAGQAILTSTLGGSWALDGECGGADAPEAIFSVAQAQGVIVVDVPEGHVVYARASCDDPFSALGCSDGDPLVIDLRSSSVTLVIDAVDGLAASEIELGITFIPEGCGDGVPSATEGCDDGNNDAGDGCSADCELEPEA